MCCMKSYPDTTRNNLPFRMVGRKRVEPTCCVFELKLKYPAEVKLEKNIISDSKKVTTTATAEC